jgi:6-aminohexanoate-oligomer exohydrolase
MARPTGVTSDNWQEGPGNRWAFQHVDELVATATVSRGRGPALELSDGQPLSVPGLDDLLERTFTDGLIVLKGHEVVLERYLNGLTPATRHLLQSVSKSMCSAVVGQYVAAGALDVDQTVGYYLPELSASAYADATVQQTLDMTVAVHYDETYENPRSEVQEHERAGGWRTPLDGDPKDTYEFLAGLRKSGQHGRVFQYCSANTDVLAWLVERVAQRPFVEVWSSDLWSRIGAEHDAYVTVDAAGFPMANGGLCVTLRDLARFGRVVLSGGIGPGDTPVIPSEWVADIRGGGDPAAAADSMKEAHPHGSYRDQFWVTGDEHGCFYGVGIFGQYVWMNPDTDVVVAKLSSLPDADDTANWVEHVAFFDRLSSELTE